MTTPRSLASYGSPKKNARILANPKTDITQADWNRLVADVAALTCPAPTKLQVIFPTAASNGPVTPTWFAAQWGNDAASAPAIARTNTGVYTISTPSAWASPGIWVYTLDPDNVVQTQEQVLWSWSEQDIDAPIGIGDGKVRPVRTGYTITLYVTNTSGVLSDLGGAVPIYCKAG
jgi:hypothetical protein